jgi:DNA-binding NarL/FixJ family response regulator
VSISVVLAEDHKILREGLRALLKKESDIRVVGEVEDGHSAIRLAKKLKPSVVIMDLGMPELNGIEATKRIRRDAPSVKVLVLSMHADRHFVTRSFGAGASGYLLKDCAFQVLAGAIRAVSSGQTYLSPRVAGFLVEDYLSLSRKVGSSVQTTLTPREREVLQLLAEGKATKQIANRLGVSVKTVETHRRNLMHKLDLHSLAELTRYAIREGLTPLES